MSSVEKIDLTLHDLVFELVEVKSIVHQKVKEVPKVIKYDDKNVITIDDLAD